MPVPRELAPHHLATEKHLVRVDSRRARRTPPTPTLLFAGRDIVRLSLEIERDEGYRDTGLGDHLEHERCLRAGVMMRVHEVIDSAAQAGLVRASQVAHRMRIGTRVRTRLHAIARAHDREPRATLRTSTEKRLGAPDRGPVDDALMSAYVDGERGGSRVEVDRLPLHSLLLSRI